MTDAELKLLLHEAVQSEPHMRMVERAAAIVRNGGQIPKCVAPSELRTWYRVRSRLIDGGIFDEKKLKK